MTIDEVVQVAQAGAAAGCKEALFTLGDKPELRYRVAREELRRLGFSTTVEYLASAAKAVFETHGPAAASELRCDDGGRDACAATGRVFRWG